MTEVVHNLFLIVGAGFWGFLILVGLNPELGARLGVWLQSLGSARARRAENDRIVQELLDDDLLNEMAFQDLKDACVSTDSTRRYADRPTG